MTTPTHKGIRGDNYRIRYAAGARRHRLEDGAVRQAPRITRPVETTEMTLLLGDTAARDAFADWADEYAHDWFNLKLLQREGDVRVVGGAPAITYRQRERTAGSPEWEAALTLEAPALALDPPDGNVWPAYARVLGSGEMSADGIVRRTTIAQGPPVRQGDPAGAALLRTFRLRVLLPAEQLGPWLQWCFFVSVRRFWFPMLDGATQRRLRLHDGLGNLVLRQAARQQGAVFWLSELVAEGWDWDTRAIPDG